MRGSSLLALFLASTPLAAQTAAPVSRGAGTITAPDVARRIGIMAADSMMGRDTPSRGLDLTAQYVANEFKRFGLRPGGDSSSWFQRYPINRHKLSLEKSRLVFAAGAVQDSAGFTTAARHDAGNVPLKPVRASGVLVGGLQTVESVESLDIREKVVLYVPPAGGDPHTIPQVLRALFLSGPKALVILSDADSATFASAIPKRVSERIVVGFATGRPVTLRVRAGAVARSLSAAGVDLAATGTASTPVFQDLPLTVSIEMKDEVLSSLSAPNTVGIVEGSDPRLKHEYVVYSAHMDHIGITPGRPDSINNGADDDASGTAGVIELAEAFSRPGARPKRSVIFLTVSGEEKGLWGSSHFVEHPPVPIDQIVANVNLDMVGRNWPDTIVAIGKEHSDLGATLERVNAMHPELRMTAIDDQWPEERFYFRSDHYNFARKGVPILFFFNGVHEDYHEVTDSPEKINSEKESRILKLLYYLGQEIANAAGRPQWRPESREEIVEEKSVSGNRDKRER
jgi:Zn-dependent M28 family amino/carboxypeptidase